MIKGAIFDLDGTLIDSTMHWNRTEEAVLRELGIDPTHKLLELLHTITFDQAVNHLKQTQLPDLTKQRYLEITHAIMWDLYLNHTPLKPHVRPFLQQLQNCGVTCCIVTASTRELTLAILKKEEILSYFSFILTCDETGCSKDKPDIFRYATQRLGYNAANTVVFEDALHAIRSAKSAGLRTVALYDENNCSETYTLRETADYYCKSFADCEVSML